MAFTEFSTTDTIVAIATPQGRGGIGVVRVAGPDAMTIVCRLARRATLVPRHATFARLWDPVDGAVVDQVVLTWFNAPSSYTGDSVVEVGAHGSPWLLRRIVDLCCREGARLAAPGEFTFRAWVNGRIDLVQAEAVGDLIEASTPLQAKVAMDQLDGTLTGRIAAVDTGVFEVAAKLEASLDFPDEGFHFITREEVATELAEQSAVLAGLIADGRRGRMIREGGTVVIAGRPNVGKSSLFNALLGAGRAIVAPTAGTTRDLLTEVLDVDGVPVTLVDTAGVRRGGEVEVVEAEGVRRAEAAAAAAALTLIVLDGSCALTSDDRRLLDGRTERQLVVINKVDAPRAWRAADEGLAGSLEVSARSGDGLTALRTAIASRLVDGEERRDTPAMSNLRHVQCAEAALEAVERALSLVRDGATEELVLAELTEARNALERLTGRRSADDVLAHIFSRFCIGK